MSGRQLPENVAPDERESKTLRAECRERGFTVDHCTDLALGYVLAAAGSVELAADALAMTPRPMWVEEFCGP